MLPVLLHFGAINIYSFGTLIFVGFLLGMFISWKKVKEYHIESQVFFDIVFRVSIWVLVLSRVFYIVLEFDKFGFSPLKWLWFAAYPGLSVWGAILGGIIGVVHNARQEDIKLFTLSDLLSLGLSFFVSSIWFGAFLDGFPKAITTGKVDIWYYGTGESMFPAHIILWLMFIILSSTLWYLEPRYRMFGWYRNGKSSAKTGLMTSVFLMILGISGMLASVLFVDRWWIGPVNMDLALSLLLVLIGLLVLGSRTDRISLPFKLE